MNRLVPANRINITIRDGFPADAPFFEELYFLTRRDEFAGLGWDELQLAAFIKMQFEAQTRGYAMQFPNARISVIENDGAPVGRLIATDEVRLVDIIVSPGARNRGIGSFVLKYVLDAAGENRKDVILQVLKTNAAAIRLYERFGFEKTAANELYLTMMRRRVL